MKRVLLVFLGLWVLVACTPQASAPALQPGTSPLAATPTTNGSLATTVPTPTSPDRIEVDAWVKLVEPAESAASGRGQIIIYGSLIKNSVRLGGVVMRARWSQAGYPDGVRSCFAQTNYGRALCVLDAADFPSGVRVPVTMTFDYGGQTYTGKTAFTPR